MRNLVSNRQGDSLLRNDTEVGSALHMKHMLLCTCTYTIKALSYYLDKSDLWTTACWHCPRAVAFQVYCKERRSARLSLLTKDFWFLLFKVDLEDHFSSREVFKLIPQWLYEFATPATVKFSFSPHSKTCFQIYWRQPFWLAWGVFQRVLICIFLMARDIEHL